jgi:hypothetical protein
MVLETITERGVLSVTNSGEFSPANSTPYIKTSGNVTTATLSTADIGTAGTVGKVIELLSGKGAGQKRIISDVTGNEITVSKDWNIIPDSTTAFIIHSNSGQCQIQNQDNAINTIKLASDDSASPRFYDYCYVKLVKGSGKGQLYEILSYDETEKIITIDGRHNISPNSSTYYIIYGESGSCISATSTTATLDNMTSVVSEKHYIEIMEGTGQGQIKMITSADSKTGIISVSEWDIVPDATSIYNIFGGWGSSNYENILRHSVITITSDINISGGESAIIVLESAMDTAGANSIQNITELSYYVPTVSHSITVSTQFFRLRFVSMGTSLTGRVQTIINSYKTNKLNYKIEGNITDHSGCDLSRSIIAGKTVGGEYTNIHADKTGNIWTSIKSPIDGFGSVITTQPRQYTELMFLNNLINVASVVIENSGGNITTANNICSVATASDNSSVSIYTLKRMRYNPGLAVMVRFTAMFSEPTATGEQIIGYGDCCDGFFFGYNGLNFGILHRRGGKCEIRRLTITAGASGSENINITLDDVKSPDIAILDTDNTFQIARKIVMSGVFASMGWNVYEEGNSVLFVSREAAPLAGTYSIATTATASFTTVQTGAVPTEIWTYQPDWNKDTCLNINDMPYINFQRGNVFEIGIQWLGFGNITFKIENPRTGYFSEVHQLKYSNEHILTSLENPNLPLYVHVMKSTGANVWVKTPSMGMFIMGDHNRTMGGRLGISSHHYTGDKTLTAGTYYNLITLRNMTIFNGNRNYNEIFALALSLCFGAGPTIKRGGIFTFFANVLLDNSAGLTWTKRNVYVSTVEYSKDIVEFSGGSELLSIPVSVNDGYSMPITDLEFVVIPNVIVTLAFKPFETLTTGDSGADITFSVSWIQR